MRRWARTLGRREWLRLSGFACAVAAAIWKGRRIDECWCGYLDTR
jgi:hypothetical protein